MNTTDLDAMNRTEPVLGALPGEPVPYYLASGEGLRFETGGQLWTVIARTQDTGGLFDAAFILGPRGSGAEFHSLPGNQRTYQVFEGSAQFWLAGPDGVESRVLVPGDSAHVPPGTAVAYRFESHLTKVLLYSAPGGALDALLASDADVGAHVYSAQPDGGRLILPSDAQLHRLELPGASDAWDSELPDGATGYFLRYGEGDARAWPDALNTYGARGRNTGGRYLAVNTLAAPQPYIIRHFHQQHTENFLCVSGRIWLWVNGTELLLTPGDFLHAPAGTVHSFAIAAHNTRMLGILTSDVFEPFFDVTSEPTDDHVYTEGLVDPSTVIGGIKANPDLDLVVVGGPPERVRAAGI